MDVLVLQGSPNAGGSTAMLAGEFARGALEAHHGTLVRYLGLRGCGRVPGGGCGAPAMTARSGYPEAAFGLGRSL